MIYIKQKGNRYYRESRLQIRSFPIKAAEARELLRTGKAELIDRFLWEPEPEPSATEQKPFTAQEIEEAKAALTKHHPVKPSVTAGNVLDFTARLKAKQEQEATNKAIDKFKSDYLPFITAIDAAQIAQAQESQQANIIARICMRIDMERGVR